MNRANALQMIANQERRANSIRTHAETIQWIAGGPLYHSVGDRQETINQLGTDFATMQNEMASQMGWTHEHPSYDESSALYKWWKANAEPTIEAWQNFQANNQGWFDRFTLSWDVLETWHARLLGLRTAAESNGFHFTGAIPQNLQTTVFQDAGSVANRIGGFLKTLTYAAVAIGGFVVVVTVLKK